MEAEYNHLNHATWDCKYHVEFTPKYRKNLLFGKIKRHPGQVFHDLARRSPCRTKQSAPEPESMLLTCMRRCFRQVGSLNRSPHKSWSFS